MHDWDYTALCRAATSPIPHIAKMALAELQDILAYCHDDVPVEPLEALLDRLSTEWGDDYATQRQIDQLEYVIGLKRLIWEWV